MPRKTKQAGLEGSYSDSMYYEWYVEFDDSTEMTMFYADGSERMLRGVLDYLPTSDIKRVGLLPFDTTKADAVNNHQDHDFTVISTVKSPYYYNIPGAKKGKVPWLMRRKQHVDGYIQMFYEVGPDKDGDEFYLIDKDGNFQAGTSIPMKWV